ncbi:MAG: hypothetical protein R3C58_15855 [Parvularculaceae bacterium]
MEDTASVTFIDVILRATGGLAIIGSLVLGFMRLFADRWISNRFEKGLSELEHKQELELQRLRIEIDSKINANLRLQDKEFETLSKAWQLLQIAYIEIASFVSVMEQFPELNKLADEDIEEFLADADIADSQKNYIRKSSDRTKAYRDVRFMNNSRRVWQAHLEFRDYILQYAIFFPKSIRSKFQEIEEKLRGAIIAKEVGRPINEWKMQAEAWTSVTKETKKVCDALGIEIHDRLAANTKFDLGL